MLAVLPLLLLLGACDRPGPGDPEGRWRGEFSQGAGCVDGVVRADLRPLSGGGWGGEYHYTGTEPGSSGNQATYRVEGAWSGDRLVLEQVELVRSDRLVGSRWCRGVISLEWTEVERPSPVRDLVRRVADVPPLTVEALHGTYRSDECGCTGVVTLEPSLL